MAKKTAPSGKPAISLLAERMRKIKHVIVDGKIWRIVGQSMTKSGFWTLHRYASKIVGKVKVRVPEIKHMLESEILAALDRHERTLQRVTRTITRKLGVRRCQFGPR